jgi:hypothetical protein
VRDLHLSTLRRLRLLGPIPALGWLWEHLRGSGGPPGAPPPPPDGVTAPSPQVIAPTGERIGALGRVKQDVTQLVQRPAATDLATGIQLAATSGGGRSAAAVGAIVGLCLSGVGAGTVCVVSGVVPELFRAHPKPAARLHAHQRTVKQPSAPSLASELAAARPTPTPAPLRTIAGGRTVTRHRQERPSPARDPAQGHAPSSQEHAPISPAAPTATTEFAASAASGSGTSAPPAHAPATGGDEFGP